MLRSTLLYRWETLIAEAGMQKSDMLDLSRQRLSPAGSLPEAWAGMTAMQELYLHNNFFKGLLPAEWASMTSMRRFYAPSNMLSGLTPSACGLKSNAALSNELQSKTRKIAEQ